MTWPGDEEQIGGLDVEVLQLELRCDHVERFGGVGEVGEQFVARDAGQAERPALAEAVLKLPVGQFHHHHEFVADDLDAFERQEERVADRLDLLERVELLREPLFAAAIIGLARPRRT